MTQSIASGVMLAGGLTAQVAATGAGFVLLRFLLRGPKDVHRLRSEASLIATYWMLVFAAIAAAGLVVLIVAGVISYGFERWATALPVFLLLGTIGLARFVRHRLLQTRRSH